MGLFRTKRRARRSESDLENSVQHVRVESLVLFAADCADHVSSLWRNVYPTDDRPSKAIEAARSSSADAATAAAEAAAAAKVAYEAMLRIGTGDPSQRDAMSAAWHSAEAAKHAAEAAAMD